MTAKERVLALHPQACVVTHGVTQHKFHGVLTQPESLARKNTYLSAYCTSPRQAWSEAMTKLLADALTK